ncbi:MAG: hypothetical protein Kow0079_11030 [Vicingaceae bacterium]
MRYLKFIIVAFLLIGNNVNAQDEKAKKILDELSEKTKKYTSIKADFKLNISNKVEKVDEEQTGSIIIKGNKYILNIKGQEVISDGKTMWTIIKDAEEVQINTIDEEDENAISPNKIFSLYEKGFKYQYIDEKDGKHIIYLYPNNPKDESYHRITLIINKEKMQIVKAIVYGKDGTNFTYYITSFTPNTNVSDSQFTFDKSKYSGFEIIDLRE